MTSGWVAEGLLELRGVRACRRVFVVGMMRTWVLTRACSRPAFSGGQVPRVPFRVAMTGLLGVSARRGCRMEIEERDDRERWPRLWVTRDRLGPSRPRSCMCACSSPLPCATDAKGMTHDSPFTVNFMWLQLWFRLFCRMNAKQRLKCALYDLTMGVNRFFNGCLISEHEALTLRGLLHRTEEVRRTKYPKDRRHLSHLPTAS